MWVNTYLWKHSFTSISSQAHNTPQWCARSLCYLPMKHSKCDCTLCSLARERPAGRRNILWTNWRPVKHKCHDEDQAAGKVQQFMAFPIRMNIWQIYNNSMFKYIKESSSTFPECRITWKHVFMVMYLSTVSKPASCSNCRGHARSDLLFGKWQLTSFRWATWLLGVWRSSQGEKKMSFNPT